MRHYVCIVAALLLTACHKYKDTPVTVPTPAPVGITDSFTGTYYYSLYESEDVSGYTFDTAFALPMKVYVYHYPNSDSFSVYDNMGANKYNYTRLPYITDGVKYYNGIALVTLHTADSNKYHTCNFYIVLRGDSLLYSNSNSDIRYKSGLFSYNVVTFRGSK